MYNLRQNHYNSITLQTSMVSNLNEPLPTISTRMRTRFVQTNKHLGMSQSGGRGPITTITVNNTGFHLHGWVLIDEIDCYIFADQLLPIHKAHTFPISLLEPLTRVRDLLFCWPKVRSCNGTGGYCSDTNR